MAAAHASTGRSRSPRWRPSDFGAPGPIIDFQAPLSHTLVREKVKKKGGFEKMYLDGRPPVNIGVTSGGDIFGGTSVTVSDVLGDQQFNFFAASVSQYRTMSFSYTNLSRRINWAVQGYSQTQFYYGERRAALRSGLRAVCRSRPGARRRSPSGVARLRDLAAQSFPASRAVRQCPELQRSSTTIRCCRTSRPIISRISTAGS